MISLYNKRFFHLPLNLEAFKYKSFHCSYSFSNVQKTLPNISQYCVEQNPSFMAPYSACPKFAWESVVRIRTSFGLFLFSFFQSPCKSMTEFLFVTFFCISYLDFSDYRKCNRTYTWYKDFSTLQIKQFRYGYQECWS